MVFLLAINYFVSYLWAPSEEVQNAFILASIVFYLLVLQFFRSPNRKITTHPNLVLAPADGKVVVIEHTDETEYFNDQRIQVSIFMSPLNVHNNRAPVAGIVKLFRYHPGKYRVAWHPKASQENERTTMVLGMANGLDILVRQIAGAMARRIKWYVEEGEQVRQGQEYGFINFGSRVDVFLPTTANILVDQNDKAIGGKTVIAELI
jgi:phosphatidylserine decarboxylase